MNVPSVKTIEEICALPRQQVEADLRTVQAAKQPLVARREQLAADLQSVTDKEIRLVMQEQTLALVLRLHQDADAGLPAAAETLQAGADAAPRRREQNISANVLAIMRQAQGLMVRPAYVKQRLAEVGIEADDNVIRNALRRWAERGELIKEGHEYRSVDFRPIP